jgi:hypothetical protein
MSLRKLRDLRRLLDPIAASFGATVTIEKTNRGHLRATFMIDERRGCIIVSSTPSDWRADHKVEADARRTLRCLTAS